MRGVARFFARPTRPDPRIGFVVAAVVVFIAQTVVFFRHGSPWWGVFGIVVVVAWTDRVVRDLQLRHRLRRARRSTHAAPEPAWSGR
ncbi:hypothetical protein ACFT5B_15760 [Luteimicrobium sp. NPDC057192]|uniref:hypothetical protein n=1 Tax=Luteimicrobium sp. NPDC057192 TaxID=3346042 RepID=UPI003629C91A